MSIYRLAVSSLLSRRITVGLTILALAMSVVLFMGVEKIRNGARTSFTNTISGTDLIVGSRSGSIQLLLYAVFRIGNATNNITWQSYQDIIKRREIAWTIPLSLGDSHRGYRVLGTTQDYFTHYRYRQKQPLQFSAGKTFDDLFDTVLGADVAAKLGYKLGDRIILAHGIGKVSFAKHEEKPFKITGILAKTGTAIDDTVHVSLRAIEALHVDWQSGARKRGPLTPADQIRKMELTPKAITAVLVGLKSKRSIFKTQRFINTYRQEALSAILPGIALHELWALSDTVETALSFISALVVLTALLGLVTMVLTTLNERRREMAILRSVGASPGTIFGLMTLESLAIIISAILLGLGALYGVLYLLRDHVDAAYGFYIELSWPNLYEIKLLGAIILAGLITSILPAWRAYRLSLQDGMSIRY